MSVSLYGSGQTVIQVVQTAYSTVETTSSSSFISSGCTATITPQSTNSKILVMVSIPTYHGVANTNVGAKIMRGSSAAFSGVSSDFWQPTGSGVAGNINIQWLDSPSTTSSTTYTMQFVSWAGNSVSINKDYTGANTGVTYLTLLEISGS